MATLDDRELLRLYIADPKGEGEYFEDYKLDRLISDSEGDLYAAAAHAWRIKAANVSDWYNVSLDGGDLARGQVFTHCTRMADIFSSLGGGEIVSVGMTTDYLSDDSAIAEQA